MATTQGKKGERPISTSGSQIRIGVGRADDISTRCRATHDVPYTLRCVKPLYHDDQYEHQDKQGNRWT